MPPVTFALLILTVMITAGATIWIAFAGGASVVWLGLVALVAAGIQGWHRLRG